MKTKLIPITLLLTLVITPILIAGCTNDQSDFGATGAKEYEPTLILFDLTLSDISPSGFTATFRTGEELSLAVDWTVYPSDIFCIDDCGEGYYHKFTINTYPSGGTVFYRIIDSTDWLPAYGTGWFTQKLPYPNFGATGPKEYQATQDVTGDKQPFKSLEYKLKTKGFRDGLKGLQDKQGSKGQFEKHGGKGLD